MKSGTEVWVLCKMVKGEGGGVFYERGIGVLYNDMLEIICTDSLEIKINSLTKIKFPCSNIKNSNIMTGSNNFYSSDEGSLSTSFDLHWNISQ